jgi:hypothetical protein
LCLKCTHVAHIVPPGRGSPRWSSVRGSPSASQAAYDAHAKEVNLIEVPDDCNPLTQMQKNVKRNQGKEQTKRVPILD